MKSKLIILSILASCFVGCSSMSNFYNGLNNSSPYFRSSSALITTLVLQKAVSDEDRQEKAKIVLNLATAIETLTKGDNLSVETVSTTLLQSIPDKPHWKEYTMALVLLYTDFYEQNDKVVIGDKQKALITALNRIASGCRIAAASLAK